MTSLLGYAGIATIFAMAATFWKHIVTFVRRVWTFAVTMSVVKDGASKAVLMYAWKNKLTNPFGMRVFSGSRAFIRSRGRFSVVGYEEVSGDPMLVRFGRSILMIQMAPRDLIEKSNVGECDQFLMTVTIRAIRGTVDVDSFIRHCVESFNDSTAIGNGTQNRFQVRRIARAAFPISNGMAQSGGGQPVAISHSDFSALQERIDQGAVRLLSHTPSEIAEKTTDTPPFSLYPVPAEANALFDSAKMWLRSRDLFVSRGVPWRFGWLLYGPPGTGKSTFVRSVAISLDLPLFVFDLSTLDNTSFPEEWKDMLAVSPAIALIEDIDAVFNGRTNISTAADNQRKLTFDCLLNTISGVGVSDGVLLVVTTNDIKSIDPALGVPMVDEGGSTHSSRPGRIDRAVYFGAMKDSERNSLAKLILPELSDEERGEIVASGKGMTAAAFQAKCSDIAIQAFWKEAGQ